jgi:putative membrane protein
MSNTDWSKPQRQAPAGLILFFGNNFRKLLKIFFPAFIALLLHKSESDKTMLYLWTGIGVLILVTVSTIFSYLYFRFFIENSEFILQKGFLKKVRLSVPLERIQTINIKQNIIQKILGVVSLEVDTAGAGTVEVKLTAIKEGLAKELEEALKQSVKKATVETTQSKNREETSSDTRERVIMQLTPFDLLKVSISENHFKSFLLVLVLANWLYTQLKNFYDEEIKRLAKEGIATAGHFDFSIWISIFLFMLTVSVAISFAMVFLRFFDFRLTGNEKIFRIRFGLLNKRKINVPLSKIQIISGHTNPLRKLLNFQSLIIRQATSGGNIKKKQTIAVPACRKQNLHLIEKAAFGEDNSEFSPALRSHPLLFIRSFVLISLVILTLTLLAVQKYIFVWWAFTLLELYLITIFVLAYRKRKFRLNESLIEITRGMIGTSFHRMLTYKIQAVEFRQTILQKRRKLAGITIHTASGESLKIPYIDEKQAMDIYNYLLYKTEITDKPWM